MLRLHMSRQSLRPSFAENPLHRCCHQTGLHFSQTDRASHPERRALRPCRPDTILLEGKHSASLHVRYHGAPTDRPIIFRVPCNLGAVSLLSSRGWFVGASRGSMWMFGDLSG
ncbi:hypothetical protein BDV33DRAFT_171518 [Aspergillus novoparasiticus]|uniref:Uncharacterized protein n=1 Tax=Aspergillus novoparasiticus TaxID=986946 RepID=A0A5N6EVM2_9EURO|nr:hypothetical protein BDV33DRAFT_171518 [Aspergillus novoparasiticus]